MIILCPFIRSGYARPDCVSRRTEQWNTLSAPESISDDIPGDG